MRALTFHGNETIKYESIADPGIEQPSDEVLKLIKPLLDSKEIMKIGQNLKYEIVVFSKYGVNLKGKLFDTMVAAHFLDSSRNSYKLDELSRVYLSHNMISFKEVMENTTSKNDFSEVDLESAKNYACEDSDVAMNLYILLNDELRNRNLIENYDKYIVNIVPVLAQMEINGVKIDTNILKKLSKDFQQDLEEIISNIFSLVGHEFTRA